MIVKQAPKAQIKELNEIGNEKSNIENNNNEHNETKEKENKEDFERINIKLIDFGTCNFFDGKTPLKLKVGTPYYMAPEVLNRCYTEKCDLWSCGVIMYVLLVGYPPFSGDSTEEILLNVSRGKVDMEGQEWDEVSSRAKDLVMKLLDYNYESRISAQDAINHNWIKSNYFQSEKQVDKQTVTKVLANIKNFMKCSSKR